MATSDLAGADSDLAGSAHSVGRLRAAIAKDEFTLFCQPIRALNGAEAYPIAEVLIRMREEEKALLPPGDFIPVFEHYRMMPELDRWVVRHTLAHLAQGSRIRRFSVNVSAQTLEDVEFPRFLADQLAAHGVSAESVLFEIDESDTLHRLDAAVRFADSYRELGGSLMIDGFGRRSASFAALQAIGAKFVKVDGAITRKLLSSASAQRKMNALIQVSRALGFALVAEFVEEQDVLLRLKALGVEYAQGFGIAVPRPIEGLRSVPQLSPRA
jgi:EAL domain-containing protein (putative c-di-GMP-specific phosphodiesterase class I)